MEQIDFTEEKKALHGIVTDCWNAIKAHCFETMTYDGHFKPLMDEFYPLERKYKSMGSRYYIMFSQTFHNMLNFVMTVQTHAGNETSYWVPPKKEDKK
jgi:hypothetical protein